MHKKSIGAGGLATECASLDACNAQICCSKCTSLHKATADTDTTVSGFDIASAATPKHGARHQWSTHSGHVAQQAMDKERGEFQISAPVGLRLALQDLTLAGHFVQCMRGAHSGHAKAPRTLHAPPNHQPIPWLKDVQCHLLPCGQPNDQKLDASRQTL